MKQPNTPKRIWIPLLVGVSAVIGATNASALSVTAKPSKPVVQLIRASAKASKGTVDVSVSFSIASTNAKSPILQTQVKVGTKTCAANRTTTKCTVKSVVAGRTYKVLVRAKNRNGYGSWSSPVTVMIKAGSTWSNASNTTTNTTSTTTPNETSNTTPGLSPSTTATTTPSTTSSSTTTTIAYSPVVSTNDPAQNATAASTIRFDLSDAVGIATKTGVSSSSVKKQAVGSNLLVVLSSGLTRDAVILGTVSVDKFLIAPNNRLYVHFNSATDFGNGITTCILAQVYRSTGYAKCIESSLRYVDIGTIQFDADGNIYYSGGTASISQNVVRRYANGSAADYVNQYQYFNKFFVAPNGDILISGSTSSNGLSWTRKISTSGQITSLSSNSADVFWQFPDGNVYFPDGSTCLKRYLIASSQLDARPWASWGSNNGCSNPYDTGYIGFLSGFGNPRVWILANGSVMSLRNTELVYMYPTLKKASQSLSRISFGIPALTSAILVGTNSSGVNQMLLYDSTNDSSTTLVDGSSEIEFYHVNWNSMQNRVYFDGLRFSDNKYVIGYLNLANKQIVASDLLAKLTDFQTFSS